MKGSLMKGLTGLTVFAACITAMSINAHAVTCIYVGKDASVDNTTMIGTTLEDNVGLANILKVCEKGSFAKGDVIESMNGYKYTLPEDSAKMTVGKTMEFVSTNGWNNCAANEYGVAVVAYCTTNPNLDAVAADPFAQDGVSEEKIATILAATSKTARDAVITLCSEYEDKGARTAEIVLIADQDGAWVVENFTGHQYVATKLPDDCIATFGEEPIIRNADPDDKDTICSKQLFTLPEENGFAIYGKNKTLDLILTYNSDNTYSPLPHLNGWVGHDIFAPSEELEFDEKEGYDVFFKPDEKVSIDRAFSYFRNRFEGTPYDLSDPDNAQYFGINNQTVWGANIIQVFSDVPEAMADVIWNCPANPTATPFIPVPVLADSLPDELATDVEKEGFDDSILQFAFAGLNNDVYPHRNVYGRSIRRYWEGIERSVASDIASKIRGEWKDDFDTSAEDAANKIDGYIKEAAGRAEDDCERISDEFKWYLFKNGIRSASTPDDELPVFECSFDALSYAKANGWDTVVDGDVLRATRDDKTIEIVIDGDNEGEVTLSGFDNRKVMEDLMADGYTLEKRDEEGSGETAEEVEEEPGETEEVEEIKEEPEEAEETKEKEQIEEIKEETKEIREEAEEVKEEVKEPVDDDRIEEIASEAAAKLEVDTIGKLREYFDEKISNVPRDGWSEKEIASKLGSIASDVSDLISEHFSQKNIVELMGFDANEILNDKDVEKVAGKVSETGSDLAALCEKYISSLAEDVSADVVNGRLSQDGAVKILTESEGEIEGIAKLYIDGFTGALGDVFNTDLSDEEFSNILAELGDGALQIMDEYGAIDLDELGLSDFSLKDLTDAEIDVVITLDGMDDDVIEGLSSLLGVDVRKTLDEYLEQIDAMGIPKEYFTEEKHETEKAESAPDEKVMAAIEAEEELSEDDIVIPQEVIDILNEAITEAGGKEDDASETDDGAEDTQDGYVTMAPDDVPEEELMNGIPLEGPLNMNIGNIKKDDGKIMLPAYMSMFFN